MLLAYLGREDAHRTSSTILNATLSQLVSPPIRPPSLWLAEIFLRET